MARSGSDGSGTVMSPPNRPTIISLPPLIRLSSASCTVRVAPTRSITAQAPPLVASMVCFGVGGSAIDCRLRAGLERRLALDRIDIDDNRSLAAHGLMQRQAHES